jgi:hypothetical protein
MSFITEYSTDVKWDVKSKTQVCETCLKEFPIEDLVGSNLPDHLCNPSCPICMESFSAQNPKWEAVHLNESSCELVERTKHVFCVSCLSRWIKRPLESKNEGHRNICLDCHSPMKSPFEQLKSELANNQQSEQAQESLILRLRAMSPEWSSRLLKDAVQNKKPYAVHVLIKSGVLLSEDCDAALILALDQKTRALGIALQLMDSGMISEQGRLNAIRQAEQSGFRAIARELREFKSALSI